LLRGETLEKINAEFAEGRARRSRKDVRVFCEGETGRSKRDSSLRGLRSE
jgi:hypothetical protein